MRILLIASFVLVLFATLLDGQSEPDPYSLTAVGFELKMNSGGQRVTHSWSQKGLARIGDGVSIAILKILPQDQLKNPERVKDYLPIIRSGFGTPDAISLSVNRDPKATLFLLNYLLQDVPDTAVQEEIRQTIQFVQEKCSQELK
jgi:hypothetical protein